MEIIGLGYVGIGSPKTEEWSKYAVDLLGMQEIDKGAGKRAYRMDDRRQRLIIDPSLQNTLGYMGWEVSSGEHLSNLADRLDHAGVKVAEGSSALANERWVARLISFEDPEGNRLEAYFNSFAATEPFRPGRPIAGFRTGALGMGHIVLDVNDIDRLLPFYRDLLGFKVSDFGLAPYKLYFFHVNGRHHSFAMVEGGNRKIHHIMLEVKHLDDVGQGYDLALLQKDRIAYTLGRHTNDHVTSFYTHTPSSFFVEYGWGGRTIDPASWQAHQTFDGPSLWGHDRLYMAAEPRKRLQDMRLNAAAKGARAPLAPDCLWFESVVVPRK
jgi:2,3-dihydroxybiphenyl 1,2-dioxygenase